MSSQTSGPLTRAAAAGCAKAWSLTVMTALAVMPAARCEPDARMHGEEDSRCFQISRIALDRHPPDGRRLQRNLRPFRAAHNPRPPPEPRPDRRRTVQRRAEAKLNAESAKSSSIKTHVSRLLLMERVTPNASCC